MPRLPEVGKKWVTHNPWLRLATTLVGITVTDTFLLSIYHQIIDMSKRSHDDQESKVSIERFARILVHQLINLAEKQKGNKYLPEEEEALRFIFSTSDSRNDLSTQMQTTGFGVTAGRNVICSSIDANNILHYLIKYDMTTDPCGRKCTKMHKCKLCLEKGKQRDVGQYCITFGESYSLCNNCNERDCFGEHIKNIKQITRQTKKSENYHK